MPNFNEGFPSPVISNEDEKEENKIEEEESIFEEEDEFEEKENETENDENETESANKSNGSRTGLKTGLLTAFALLQGVGGGVKTAESAESQFASKEKNKTGLMVNSEMENEENSQEMSHGNAKFLKALEVISEDQLAELADSTGLINLSKLVEKIIRYSPNTYFIDYKNKELGGKIVKEAKMRRIEGTTQLYVCGFDKFAMVSKYKDEYGKTREDISRIGQVPQIMHIDMVRNIVFVFDSK